MRQWALPNLSHRYFDSSFNDLRCPSTKFVIGIFYIFFPNFEVKVLCFDTLDLGGSGVVLLVSSGTSFFTGGVADVFKRTWAIPLVCLTDVDGFGSVCGWDCLTAFKTFPVTMTWQQAGIIRWVGKKTLRLSFLTFGRAFHLSIRSKKVASSPRYTLYFVRTSGSTSFSQKSHKTQGRNVWGLLDQCSSWSQQYQFCWRNQWWKDQTI